MEELGLHFFPYPYVLRGKRREGALHSWPKRCSECDRQCETSASHGLSLCSYGVNFQRVDDDFLIAGVIVSDFPTDTPARRKIKAGNHQDLIRSEDIQRVVERFRAGTEVIEAERRDRLEAVVSEYRETKGYQKDVLDQLRPELEQTLGQVHDYKQFVQQIVQNMIVLLESRFPGLPLEEKLEKAERQEAAIYWAAVIMDEKLDAALFLESPERIYEKREQHRFRFHGMVLKYVRIYESRAEGKKVSVVMPGESWGEISGNSRALGIIPHTLIDNAIKYAPEGSKVNVEFDETPKEIKLSVVSHGPHIRADEKDRIFDLFYRGRSARRRFKEGTGFGLASAQNIARAHDTRIAVKQDLEPDKNGNYLTTFSVKFKRSGRSSKGSK